MTQEQRKTRQRKSQLLEVKQITPITFMVQSQSNPEMYRKVTVRRESGVMECMNGQ